MIRALVIYDFKDEAFRDIFLRQAEELQTELEISDWSSMGNRRSLRRWSVPRQSVDLVIAFLNERALSSRWLRSELDATRAAHVPLIGVWTDRAETRIPLDFRAVNWKWPDIMRAAYEAVDRNWNDG